MTKLTVPSGKSVALRLCAVLVVLGLLAACAPRPITRETALVRIAPGDAPVFIDDAAYDQLARGIAMSLLYLRKRPPQHIVYFGADGYTVAHLIRSLETFADLIAQRPKADQLGRMIGERFHVYQAVGRNKRRDVLFTG
jgi:hypothetical protein